ncbi:hypothetical protein DXG01_016243 [Tephrocybe rancida]|nr:hypothetical protein DXG01_016243 [Tephrocybe rancida]
MARILLDDSLTDHLTSIERGVWDTSDEIGSIYIGGSAIVVGVSHVMFDLNFTVSIHPRLTKSVKGTSIAFYGHLLGDQYPTNDTYNWVTVDNASAVNIFLPQGNVVDLWYETPSMPDATHTIFFHDFPTMLIDYAVVTAGRETPLTGQTLLVDDTDAGIEYTGSWMQSSSVIQGTNATSRAPVGGSTYGTGDQHASATFRFTGTAVSVYGISPSEDGVVVSFTLDGNISRMNQYNASLPDPNFLWYSQHDLFPGNHTLVMEFASDTSTRNFTLDYITYTPSFDTLASLGLTTPGSASTNELRRTIIGSVMGPTTFLLVVLALLCWRRRRAASKRLKLSSLEGESSFLHPNVTHLTFTRYPTATPYTFTSISDSDGSTRSLVPSTSGLPGPSPSTELPNNSPMLEVQRKPRLPGHPTSSQTAHQSETLRSFLQEVRKPPLPQASRPTTIERDCPALQPQHKPPLPGAPSRSTQGVHDTEPEPGPSPPTELPNNSPMLEVQRKPRLLGHPTSPQTAHQSDTSRPFLQEVRKSPLPQASRPTVTEQDHPVLQPQHKPTLPGTPSRPAQGVRDTEPEPLHEQHRSPLPGRSPQKAPVSRDSKSEPLQKQHKSRLPDESSRKPHSRHVEEPLPEEIRILTLPGGRTPPEDPASAIQEQPEFILPGRSQLAEGHDRQEGAATVREQRNSAIAGTSTRAPGAGGGGNARASAAGPPPEGTIQRHDVPHIQEQRKPRLTVRAAEDIRGEGRADENVAALRVGTAQPHPTPVFVDVPQSATESTQSPTRRRMRWSTFRRSEAAHIEPFMLSSPNAPSSEIQEQRRAPSASLSTGAPSGQGGEGSVRGQEGGTPPDGDVPRIQEQRKPRLTVHAAEYIREARRVAETTAPARNGTAQPEPTPADNHPQTPGVQSPIIRSATESAQSPTTRRLTRWWAFRRSDPAHIEPFLLPSPSAHSSEHRTSFSAHPDTPSRGREERNVDEGGEGVRQMLESANLRLTVLENDRANSRVPPPPYESDA